MKTISAALKTHLGQETTTLCTLWKITRTDGHVFGFTDASGDVSYAGVIYRAATGHTPTNIKTTSALNVDNLEVIAALDSSTLTETDMMAGLWDYAAVEIVQVNYADLTMGHLNLRRGWLGQLKTARSQFTAELRGMTQSLQQVIGRIYSAACDADLGDARCGINLAGFTVTGSVTSVTDVHSFTDVSRSETAGYFDGGKITFTSGLNAGYSMEVKTFAAGLIVLQQSMPNAIAIGDTYRMQAGCDKIKSTCIARFNNVLNFRGFEVPGIDRMVSGK